MSDDHAMDAASAGEELSVGKYRCKPSEVVILTVPVGLPNAKKRAGTAMVPAPTSRFPHSYFFARRNAFLKTLSISPRATIASFHTSGKQSSA